MATKRPRSRTQFGWVSPVLLAVAALLALLSLLNDWYTAQAVSSSTSDFFGVPFFNSFTEEREAGPFDSGGGVLDASIATAAGVLVIVGLLLVLGSLGLWAKGHTQRDPGKLAGMVGLAGSCAPLVAVVLVAVFADPDVLNCASDGCHPQGAVASGWILALIGSVVGAAGALGAFPKARSLKSSRTGPAAATRMRARKTSGATGTTVLEPGALFLGKYRVEKELGRGAFGSTWLAEHEKLKRKAVIKQLHPEWSAVPEARERFQREAHILAAMDHDHVTRVYDCEEVSGSWYLVMEYIEGGSLEEKLVKGPLSAEDAVRVTAEILEGLDYIHEQSILHRDVKPSNILLTRRGGVKIADFGVARSGGSAPGLTVPGSTPGTPIYMAPEQLRGQQGDERSDLFAVGALFYHLVTGGHHFGNTPRDEFELRRRVLEEPPKLPIPEMRESLNAWLERSLAKKPADRYPSAYAMREALLLAAPPNA